VDVLSPVVTLCRHPWRHPKSLSCKGLRAFVANVTLFQRVKKCIYITLLYSPRGEGGGTPFAYVRNEETGDKQPFTDVSPCGVSTYGVASTWRQLATAGDRKLATGFQMGVNFPATSCRQAGDKPQDGRFYTPAGTEKSTEPWERAVRRAGDCGSWTRRATGSQVPANFQTPWLTRGARGVIFLPDGA